MVCVVKLALETVHYIVHVGEPGSFQCLACINRAIAATTDDDDSAIAGMPRQALHFTHKLRIQLPLGAILPRYVDGTHGVADEKVFCITTAVNKQRIRIIVQ